MFGVVEISRQAAGVVAGNAPWMAWNFLLALVPLALAVRLFRQSPDAPRTRLWWAGVVAFVLFLPNAPYVLTDVIHLYGDVRTVPSDTMLSLAVVPQYALFMLGGVIAYVASVLLAERYVGGRWVRFTAHGLSSVGIYLGRVVRLNSWDVFARPLAVLRAVADTVSVPGVLILGVMFCTLAILTDVLVWAWAARQRWAEAG